jgi:hypothetical protein
MKLVHWLAVAGVAYFVVVGINELLVSDNATIDMLPDFGSLVGAQSGQANYAAAALDLGAAAGLYFLVLHKRLMA